MVANVRGPQLYLQRYVEYYYLLDGSAEKSLKDFFKIEPAPFLRDFGAKIKGYDELRNEIFLFRNKVRISDEYK